MGTYPPPGYDANGNPFNIGDVVMIPVKVTAISPSSSQNGIPLITGVSIYNSPNDTPLTISTAYANQTVLSQ